MTRRLRLWLQRRRHPGRYARLSQLLPALHLKRSELLQRQRADFDAIARYAAAHTDYYARRYASAMRHAGRRLLPEDLPILEKSDVIAHRDELLARGLSPHDTRLGHTGGSTGSPLSFYYDDAKHELMLAGMMRGFMLSGWRPGQKVLYLWGASRDVASGGIFGGPQHHWLSSEMTVAAVEYSEQRLAGWVRLIRRWRPVLLYGYASALSELARFVIDSGCAPPTGLLGVYSTAEVLQEEQRTLMERAFSCKVFNQYGCREVPNIAWECRHGNMHVFSDMVQLESVADPSGDRLLVTSLTDRVMPFIRYALGDSGRLIEGECPCGLGFPLMQMDLCRNNDLVRTADGRRLHPAFFNRLMYGLNQVSQYQWVQTGPDSLQLRLVSRERLSPETVDAIGAAVRDGVGPQMTLEIAYLDAIPRTTAGKHRFVIGLSDAGMAARR